MPSNPVFSRPTGPPATERTSTRAWCGFSSATGFAVRTQKVANEPEDTSLRHAVKLLQSG